MNKSLIFNNSEEVLKAVFYALPIGICITDKDGRLVYINESYCRIYGYSHEELIDKSFLIVVPEENHASFKRMHDEFLRTKKERFPYYFDVKTKNGEIIQIKSTASYFEDQEGNPYKVTTVIDITEELRLKEMNEDAERVVRHDLKAPLNGIMGFTQLLLADKEIHGQNREYLEYIYNGCKNMNFIITNYMDITRMEKGLYHLKPSEFNLVKLLRDISMEFTIVKEYSENDLIISINGYHLEESMDVIVKAEEILIKRMLENLVKNAFEASPKLKPISVCVEVQSEVTIKIHNEGTIPEHIRRYFFNKYTTSKSNGTGLGTYSAKAIAKVHGGNISFETSEENGTTITVILPIGI